MQNTILAVAVLVYAAAVIHAWRVLPGAEMLKAQRTLIFPALFLIATFTGALWIAPVRSALTRHLWITYQTGFGQSALSVLVGVAVLIAIAGFIFWQVHAAIGGGRYPGGAFSGYAAGIGLLAVQAILVRRMERDPDLRRQIEQP